MDQNKLDQLKKDISDAGNHITKLIEELKVFCLDLSVSRDDMFELCRYTREELGIGSGYWEKRLDEERHNLFTKGRESNAQVFAQKYLGAEVIVNHYGYPHGNGERGIVSGYVSIGGAPIQKVILEIEDTIYYGPSNVGTFSYNDMLFTFLRPVKHYIFDWDARDLEIVNVNPALSVSATCQCGSDKVGSAIHSIWCPQHKA